MKIAITGASGYIGQALKKHLILKGHHIIPIKRQLLYGSYIRLAQNIEGVDAIINLAGASILQRWTKKNRNTIYQSRILTTANLVKAINSLTSGQQPKIFITASAIGIYKSGAIHDENSINFSENFAGKVVADWENESNKLNKPIQKTVIRIGLVLGKNSKPILNMTPVFKFGLGGTIAGGKQPFPYIHINDLVRIFDFILSNKISNSIYNAVTPENIYNSDFTKEFAKIVKRPALFNIPEWVLFLLFGEASQLLLNSPIVVPKNLIDDDFKFNFETIEMTLNEILKN